MISKIEICPKVYQKKIDKILKLHRFHVHRFFTAILWISVLFIIIFALFRIKCSILWCIFLEHQKSDKHASTLLKMWQLKSIKFPITFPRYISFCNIIEDVEILYCVTTVLWNIFDVYWIYVGGGSLSMCWLYGVVYS